MTRRMRVAFLLSLPWILTNAVSLGACGDTSGAATSNASDAETAAESAVSLDAPGPSVDAALDVGDVVTKNRIRPLFGRYVVHVEPGDAGADHAASLLVKGGVFDGQKPTILLSGDLTLDVYDEGGDCFGWSFATPSLREEVDFCVQGDKLRRMARRDRFTWPFNGPIGPYPLDDLAARTRVYGDLLVGLDHDGATRPIVERTRHQNQTYQDEYVTTAELHVLDADRIANVGGQSIDATLIEETSTLAAVEERQRFEGSRRDLFLVTETGLPARWERSDALSVVADNPLQLGFAELDYTIRWSITLVTPIPTPYADAGLADASDGAPPK